MSDILDQLQETQDALNALAYIEIELERIRLAESGVRDTTPITRHYANPDKYDVYEQIARQAPYRGVINAWEKPR